MKHSILSPADESAATTTILPSLRREFIKSYKTAMPDYGFMSTVVTTTVVDFFKDLYFINSTTSDATHQLNAFEAFDSSRITAAEQPILPLGIWLSVIVGALLLTLFLFCVVGNMFVIMAVLLERDLRSRPQYYLIFSLAIADLLVGIIVTPLGAWTTLNQAWHLGVTLCDFWISVDVLVCTASILHLVAIALDRYWSVTDIYYVQNRTPKRIFSMLLLIWVVSLLISLAPIFGWKDAQFVARVQEQHICLISQQISYQVFSTATAFYIPLCAIIVVYYKIMRAAKKRFKRERDRRTLNKCGLSENACLTGGDPNAALKLTVEDAEGNGTTNISSGTFKTKVVAVHKQSAPSLLLPSKISLNNSSGLTCENNHFKSRSESPNNSTSDEEECAGNNGVSRVAVYAVSANSTSATKGNFCRDTFRVAQTPTKNYESHDNDNNDTVTSNHLASNHSDGDNNNKNNNCGSAITSLASASSQIQLKTQFIKKLNTKSLFVKRPVGINGGAGATAALIKRRKGTRALKESTESQRERKAWRTLAIITGTFVACWTPFFLVSLYRPICACHIPPVVEDVTQWLGYLNSALNPVIYTVFSTDFRVAFQRILKRMCLIKEF